MCHKLRHPSSSWQPHGTAAIALMNQPGDTVIVRRMFMALLFAVVENWEGHTHILYDRSITYFFYLLFCNSSGTSLQSIHRPRFRAQREAQTASNTNHFHIRSAEGAGARLSRDPLPGYLYARGDCHEDRSHRGESAGKILHKIKERKKKQKTLNCLLLWGA